MRNIPRRSVLLLATLALVYSPVANAQATADTESAASVEVIRSLYDSFARGDVPSVLGKLDANIAWTIPEGLYYGGTYRGPEAVLNSVFMRLATEWDDFRVVPSDFVGHGDHVLVRGRYTGSYKGTGAKLDVPFVHVYRVQNGLVAEYQGFSDTAQINKVAGK